MNVPKLSAKILPPKGQGHFNRTPIVLVLPIVVILDVDAVVVLWHYNVVVPVDAQVVGVATRACQ